MKVFIFNSQHHSKDRRCDSRTHFISIILTPKCPLLYNLYLWNSLCSLKMWQIFVDLDYMQNHFIQIEYKWYTKHKWMLHGIGNVFFLIKMYRGLKAHWLIPSTWNIRSLFEVFYLSALLWFMFFRALCKYHLGRVPNFIH